jgi:hypothetical protein
MKHAHPSRYADGELISDVSSSSTDTRAVVQLDAPQLRHWIAACCVWDCVTILVTN